MLPCPSCGRPLARSAPGPAEHWACGKCGGRAFTLGRMRAAFPAPFFNKVQAATGTGGWRTPRRCPLCTMHLIGCRVEHAGSTWALDHCDRCRLVWFDRGEHEAAEERLPAPPPPDPVHDGRQARVVYGGGAADRDSFEASESLPDGSLEDLPALLGFAVPKDVTAASRPWATLLLAGVIVAASLLAFATGGEQVLRERGLVPATPFRHGGLDFVTSFLLHAGFWHLLSNTYFLVAFGIGVEGVLRPGRYLLLVGLSALAGKLLYVVAAHGSPVPCVGASGGVSGILAYWALAFPHARVRTFEIVWARGFTYTFSARMAFGLWIALQVVGTVEQWAGFTNVNHLAHLGGAAVGAAFWYFGPDGPRPAAVKGDTIRLSTPLRWED